MSEDWPLLVWAFFVSCLLTVIVAKLVELNRKVNRHD